MNYNYNEDLYELLWKFTGPGPDFCQLLKNINLGIFFYQLSKKFQIFKKN